MANCAVCASELCIVALRDERESDGYAIREKKKHTTELNKSNELFLCMQNQRLISAIFHHFPFDFGFFFVFARKLNSLLTFGRPKICRDDLAAKISPTRNWAGGECDLWACVSLFLFHFTFNAEVHVMPLCVIVHKTCSTMLTWEYPPKIFYKYFFLHIFSRTMKFTSISNMCVFFPLFYLSSSICTTTPTHFLMKNKQAPRALFIHFVSVHFTWVCAIAWFSFSFSLDESHRQTPKQ